ncbi:amino acid abc transporter substrate-binding protein [Leptolyngbya sp. Heron Island J]|uniref:peptidoglycan-binding protein n=1 Tax=Leptolyngbya sp. Heron Island J TaxID=1385935 RepID=UPI0003B94308|nr:transporter substrate-binding domain-containing protein [Leptolyngbya sp. Heron Island J]ESA38949.1 amino acid abc transporter substrate-binding protein [Leptolyngbya sp. Heron Island J]
MIKFLLPRPYYWLSRTLFTTVLILSCSLLQVIGLSHPALASSLGLGSERALVEQLQTQLRSIGYVDLDVTGVYDELTRQAIQNFQQDSGLSVDGIAGAETHRQLAEKSAFNAPRTAMPPDIQRVLDRGKLIVALLGTDNPPFFTEEINTSDSVGLDIKIAQGLADALGVNLEFNRSAHTFDDVVDKVYGLEADIAISKLSRTLSRAQRVRFSQPYVTMRQGLLMNRLQLAKQSEGNQIIEAIRNFNGNVGVIQGSSYVGFIKQKFPQATIQEYPIWDDIVEAVVNGEIQAAYRDELEVKKVIFKNPDAALRLQTIALNDTQDQIAMALPWDSQNLQAFVNQYLDTFNLSFTADDVLDEYAAYLQK